MMTGIAETDASLHPIRDFANRRLSANHLNFYRIHLLAFMFIPLICSGIFYASNGPLPKNQIPYIDALFMYVPPILVHSVSSADRSAEHSCTSAMTVTGLNSVELGRMTTWQQVMIFVRFSNPFVSSLT